MHEESSSQTDQPSARSAGSEAMLPIPSELLLSELQREIDCYLASQDAAREGT